MPYSLRHASVVLEIDCTPVTAVTVYKCTTPRGNVAFLDHPCPAGTIQTQVWLPDAPPAPTQPVATASREQTCGWLQKQYDEVAHKLHNAFKDQQAILQPQVDALENQLNGC